MTKRNSLFRLLFLVFCFESCFQQCQAQLTIKEDGIATASMTAMGIDSIVINRIDTTIRNGTYPNIHSLLITRHNALVYEKYWAGKDESWGDHRGIVMHSKDDLHDIRSISKSFVSACIGIA